MTKPIKIGMIVPFTGPPALRGNGPLMHAGTAAWLALYNERGGHRGTPIELLVEDSGYDIAITAAAIRKLAEEDGVVALLNTNGTPQLTAAMPYLQSRKLPLLLPFGGAEAWFHPPRWGVFGVQAPFNDVGYLLGQWAAREEHRRVTVFHPHYPEISPLMAEQACFGFNAAKQDGAHVNTVEVQLSCDDVEAMADAILNQNPDAIVVLVNWVELAAATRAMHRRGRKVPLYSWSANVTQQIASIGGDLLEGMKGYASLLVGPMADAPAAQTYRSALARFFPDQKPDFLSMSAFAHAMAFTGALERIDGEVDAEGLVAAFELPDALETGILPPISFTSSRHMGIRQVQPMQLTDGIWQARGAPADLPFQTD